jgi:hypothetical protein
MDEQTCIVVVGMHRSGTSALTGAIHLSGCALGGKLMGPYADNPRGFFENEKIWRMNEAFLQQFNSSWDDPFLRAERWYHGSSLASYRKNIARLLDEEFPDESMFGIKDPRMCFLYPLWRDVCREMKINTVCIVSLRNPFEVAASLNRRNSFSTERGLVMWMNYMLMAELVTRDSTRCFVRYDTLLRDPRRVLSGIEERLGISFPQGWDQAGEEIEAFMDRGLKHHSESAGDVSDPVISCIHELHNLLAEAADTEEDGEVVKRRADSLRDRWEGIQLYFFNEDVRELGLLRKKAQDQDALLEKRNMELEEKKKTVKELEGTLHSQGVLLSDKQRHLAELESEITRMRRTRAWRLAEFLRKAARSPKK